MGRPSSEQLDGRQPGWDGARVVNCTLDAATGMHMVAFLQYLKLLKSSMLGHASACRQHQFSAATAAAAAAASAAAAAAAAAAVAPLDAGVTCYTPH